MPPLSIPYEPGTVPQLTVRVGCGNGELTRVGTVDSGSSRSLFPKVFAEDLGLAEDDLVLREEKGEPAIGAGFDLWEAKGIAFNGQIVVPDPGEGDFLAWGPMFPMDLVFAETDTLLLGQSDFFAAFDVKFLRNGGDALLEIGERPKKLRGP